MMSRSVRHGHVEVKEIEIVLANVNGKIYAVSERCGHQNAPLSKGTLNGKIITCPLHHAQFDVTTGKMISGMVELSLPGMDTGAKRVPGRSEGNRRDDVPDQDARSPVVSGKSYGKTHFCNGVTGHSFCRKYKGLISFYKRE